MTTNRNLENTQDDFESVVVGSWNGVEQTQLALGTRVFDGLWCGERAIKEPNVSKNKKKKSLRSRLWGKGPSYFVGQAINAQARETKGGQRGGTWLAAGGAWEMSRQQPSGPAGISHFPSNLLATGRTLTHGSKKEKGWVWGGQTVREGGWLVCRLG